ncbi:MAG: ferrous iron transport protein B [Thermodesulfobacteriota bacterium]|nr:ferrous iron transport protein B [Thermodesulfobacteriota bacterium]
MDLSAKPVTVALASIPNSGKTTLFNRFTGSSQSTGNWPGVSVEQKSGTFPLGEYNVTLIDLPGAYALSPVTEEEQVVRDYFLGSPPDIILNVLDARNLQRGLGLTLQMAVSGLPMVVAVNMMDEIRRQGITLDLQALIQHLGVPVIEISAKSGEGLPDLKEALYEVIKDPQKTRIPHISCPPLLEKAFFQITEAIDQSTIDTRLDHTFLAMRLLETENRGQWADNEKVAALTRKWQSRLKQSLHTSFPVACANCRFNAARGLAMEVLGEQSTIEDKLSRRLDHIFLHRFFGLPIFILLMFLLFQGVYSFGAPLQEILSVAFDKSGNWLSSQTMILSLPAWLQSFLFDGIWQGIAVVTSFLPIIALFFFFMSVIEDSGYMARVAFLMDRLMHTLGLDGKAFISILLGYGCNVPAVMGTRILSNSYSRILTMLLIPFTLCTARLQIFVFLTAIFFTPTMAPWIILSLYGCSFVAVILTGIVLKLFRIGGNPEPFIMEIPPYRFPTLRSIGLRSWYEMKDFLSRAATLIMAGVLLVWLLSHMPADVPPASAATWAGQLGQILAPVFQPLGIGWQETVALIFGFIAKEIVVGSLAVIYEGTDLAGLMSSHISPLQSISFMIFCLLYTPCVATIAAIWSESRSLKITLISLFSGLGVAWITSFVFYQSGLLLGFH